MNISKYQRHVFSSPKFITWKCPVFTVVSFPILPCFTKERQACHLPQISHHEMPRSKRQNLIGSIKMLYALGLPAFLFYRKSWKWKNGISEESIWAQIDLFWIRIYNNQGSSGWSKDKFSITTQYVWSLDDSQNYVLLKKEQKKYLQELPNTKYDFSAYEFTREEIFSAIPDTYCMHKKMQY